jgi:replicative DNA helicase
MTLTLTESPPAQPQPLTQALSQPDLEVERVILGAIMANSEEAMPQAVEAHLVAEDFFLAGHREIFGVMADLYEKGTAVDRLTIYNALNARGAVASVGGAAYLAELSDLYGVPQNVAHYAKLVIDRSILRRLQAAAMDIADRCGSNPPSTSELLDEAEGLIYKIRDSRTASRVVLAKDNLNDVFNRIAERIGLGEDAISGVPTGFKYLDHKTGGFQRSDLLVLGGRPGMGKTSLALNFAVSVAIPAKREVRRELPPAPVAIFSMEMGLEQVLQRLLCQIGHHDLLGLRQGRVTDEEINRLSNSASILRQAPIFIDDTPALRPLELRAKARRLQSRLKSQHQSLGLIVVDYLQLMRANGRHNNREQEISEISGSLKALAKELDVPVLTLSQLKRSDELEPSLSDLRESGSIEQDADIVFFVLRKELIKTDDPNLKGQAELRIKKHRNGPTGVMNMIFKSECSTFGPSANPYQRHDR